MPTKYKLSPTDIAAMRGKSLQGGSNSDFQRASNVVNRQNEEARAAQLNQAEAKRQMMAPANNIPFFQRGNNQSTGQRIRNDVRQGRMQMGAVESDLIQGRAKEMAGINQQNALDQNAQQFGFDVKKDILSRMGKGGMSEKDRQDSTIKAWGIASQMVDKKGNPISMEEQASAVNVMLANQGGAPTAGLDFSGGGNQGPNAMSPERVPLGSLTDEDIRKMAGVNSFSREGSSPVAGNAPVAGGSQGGMALGASHAPTNIEQPAQIAAPGAVQYGMLPRPADPNARPASPTDISPGQGFANAQNGLGSGADRFTEWIKNRNKKNTLTGYK